MAHLTARFVAIAWFIAIAAQMSAMDLAPSPKLTQGKDRDFAEILWLQ